MWPREEDVLRVERLSNDNFGVRSISNTTGCFDVRNKGVGFFVSVRFPNG